MDNKITDSIFYAGVDDKNIELFESQFTVPNGISYNSYVIMDEKTAVLDTVDGTMTDAWMENLSKALDGRSVDYLIVTHMEPDHAANIQILVERFPEMRIVGNAKTFLMMPQFFDFDLTDRTVEVKEGDILTLGQHSLQFFMAPMVHWPEVMVAYESTERILFSADAFGKFGTLDIEDDWTDEARRYYFNIVGKYGAQVQMLLKKAAVLDIAIICPLHGPVLRENLAYYIGKYEIWSSYEPEEEGVVVAYASIHGNTKAAAERLAELLKQAGENNVIVVDLARDDMAGAVESAFRFSRLALAGATYDGGMFPCMEDFLLHLKAKNYQKRRAAILENGTWSPMAGKSMRAILESMKSITVCEQMVTIKSKMKEKDIPAMEAMARELLEKQ